MERLGFRGNLSCIIMAAQIGVTHFEAAAAAAANTPFATAAQAAQVSVGPSGGFILADLEVQSLDVPVVSVFCGAQPIGSLAQGLR